MIVSCVCSCATLNSDLTIQPGRRFELGGNQAGSFTVRLQNVGEVPVTIVEKKATGDSAALGSFAPGEQNTISFAPQSAVFINNATLKPARLFLVISGDKDLSMRER